MINLDTRVLDQVNENELWLILHVAKRMKSNRMTAWPSLETLSEDTRWGENTVRKWRKSLCEKGFLEIEQRTGQTPIYRFSLEGVGIYGSLSGKYEEENPYQILVPPKESKPLPNIGTPPLPNIGTPPLPNIGTPPYQILVPEVVSKRSKLVKEVVSKEIAPPAAFITTHTPDQIENIQVQVVEYEQDKSEALREFYISLEAEKSEEGKVPPPAEIQETPTSKDAGNFEANPTPQLLDLEAQSRDEQVFAAIEGKKPRATKPAGNPTAAVCAELKTPEALDFFHAIHAAWGEWIDYKRREKKGTYKTAKTEAATITALAKAVNYDPEAGRAAIEHSIAHTYQGIYPPTKGKAETVQCERYSLEDRPQAQTPAQMKDELGRFYTAHKDMLAEVQQTAETNYGQERLRSIVTDFCSNRIGKGRQNETFGQHHAEFGIWLKRQKQFDSQNTTTTQHPSGPQPQAQLRSVAPVNYSQSSPMRAEQNETK